MTDSSTDVTNGTTRAAAQLAAAIPVWSATGRAGDLVGLGPEELLHAGPPLQSIHTIPAPLLNSVCAALLFEGRATSFDQARALVLNGTVRLLPAQDRHVVTPLAAVVSQSMWLHQVEDASTGQSQAYAPVNEGSGPAQRAGLFSSEVIDRLHFVHDLVGPALANIATAPIDLLALAATGLANGDDLHAQVGQPSAALARQLRSSGLTGEVLGFLESNPHGFLNLWMAACRCMLTAAAGSGRGKLVVAAGGNGIDFGIQLSDAPGCWRSAPATTPLGPPVRDELAGHPRLPAIGDSAVIDAVGFGALALDAAPGFATLLDPALVQDMEHCRLNQLATSHPVLNRPVALDSGRVTGNLLPGVCLAALDPAGEKGIVGRGVARHPDALYR